ncbi:hypothetical protein Asp14428_34830 [Actinoplanes sp. NBRC 14428]|nr:hypothetical protein Asp14428_34830 [Actinoplanes sp. NBRC 14428]
MARSGRPTFAGGSLRPGGGCGRPAPAGQRLWEPRFGPSPVGWSPQGSRDGPGGPGARSAGRPIGRMPDRSVARPRHNTARMAYRERGNPPQAGPERPHAVGPQPSGMATVPVDGVWDV